MKRVALFLLIALVVSAVSAQPKVAVLDADLQRGIDRSAAAAVAEKLTERLVLSGRYTVLDRANVEQVLREREFQLSGLVSDTEISETGKFLGADFVVVIRVQRVDRTYLVSARMIAVTTGVIAKQSSAEGEGRASILLKLAEETGDGLAGIVRKPSASAPARKPAAKTPAPGIGTRVYAGIGGGGQNFEDNSWRYGPYQAVGLDLYGMLGIWKGLCLVGNLTYSDAIADYGAATLSADVGLGYAHPLGILLPWAALKAGYVFLDWPDYSVWYSDFQYSLDLGVDIRFGRLLVGGRFQLSLAAFAESGASDLSLLQDAFRLMVGWKL